MKAGFFQFKPEFLNVNRNIEIIKDYLYKADFDLIVLPELCNSGYFFSDIKQVKEVAEEFSRGKFITELGKIAKEKNGYIVAGFCEKAGEDFYNSAALISPDGRNHLYRKIHLFMNEFKFFKPGDLPFGTVEISGEFGRVNIGMMICYDWTFPEAARTLALEGAQIICHPSNLVMPYCQKAMYARALENHVFIITCNRIGTERQQDTELRFTGNSVIVDTKGSYLVDMSDDRIETTECRIVEINPEKALNKFINPINNVIDDRRPEFYL